MLSLVGFKGLFYPIMLSAENDYGIAHHHHHHHHHHHDIIIIIIIIETVLSKVNRPIVSPTGHWMFVVTISRRDSVEPSSSERSIFGWWPQSAQNR